MKFKELSKQVQDSLNAELDKLQERNTSTEVFLYNKLRKRYFIAYRHTLASQYGKFGGGSYWSIKYGEIGFKRSVELEQGAHSFALRF